MARNADTESGVCGSPGNVNGYNDLDANNAAYAHPEVYTYDGVNRLTLAQAQGAGSSFYLNYGYTADGSTGQYGNMTCVTNAQTNGLCPNYTFTPATNQIVGYGYDAAGNITSDGTFSTNGTPRATCCNRFRVQRSSTPTRTTLWANGRRTSPAAA